MASETVNVVLTVPRTAAPSVGKVDSVSDGAVLSTMTWTESVAAGFANASCELRNTSQSPSLAAVVTQPVFVSPVCAAGAFAVPCRRAVAVVATGVAGSAFVKVIANVPLSIAPSAGAVIAVGAVTLSNVSVRCELVWVFPALSVASRRSA